MSPRYLDLGTTLDKLCSGFAVKNVSNKDRNHENLDVTYISRDMRFPTMWYVRPAKSQISLINFVQGLQSRRTQVSRLRILKIWMSHTIYKQRHEISNMVCATSKVSDQPAHMRSLIRAFDSRLNIL